MPLFSGLIYLIDGVTESANACAAFHCRDGAGSIVVIGRNLCKYSMSFKAWVEAFIDIDSDIISHGMDLRHSYLDRGCISGNDYCIPNKYSLKK